RLIDAAGLPAGVGHSLSLVIPGLAPGASSARLWSGSRVLGTRLVRVGLYCGPAGGSACGVSRLGLRDCRGSQPERCWCGETGKRGDLSSLWAQALVGSNPATSTPASGRILTRQR